jgi:hypothetical protein
MEYNLPLKTVRRIIKKYVKGEVSLEACIYAKEFCENILRELAIASNLELQEENRLRQIQNLPIRKRIDGSIFKKVSHHSVLTVPYSKRFRTIYLSKFKMLKLEIEENTMYTLFRQTQLR